MVKPMLCVTFATVVLIIRLAAPGADLHDFYPGGGRDDNLIGFFNAHDCQVAARLVVSIHKGPIEASCYGWDPSSTSSERSSVRPAGQTHEPHFTMFFSQRPSAPEEKIRTCTM